jgi:hypothetical protein
MYTSSQAKKGVKYLHAYSSLCAIDLKRQKINVKSFRTGLDTVVEDSRYIFNKHHCESKINSHLLEKVHSVYQFFEPMFHL